MYCVSDICIMFQTYVLCFALMGHRNKLWGQKNEILSKKNIPAIFRSVHSADDICGFTCYIETKQR